MADGRELRIGDGGGPVREDALAVWYIAMRFPLPSEAFAGSDVRMLREAGIAVSVYAMRRAVPNAGRMLAERGLGGVAVRHASLASAFTGLALGARRPRLLAQALGLVLRHTWGRPGHLIRSLALIPRALHIFSLIERRRPDVVHLFWGHYPAILGHLVRRNLPDVVLSHFLGAYDLEMRYGASGRVARSADVVWTHSAANVPPIASLGVPPDRITVIHRGIDLRRFRGGAVAKIPGRIATAGRLVPEKAMDDVLRAVAELSRELADVSLVVMGEGPEARRLRALAASLGIAHIVSFRGHVSQNTLRDEMARADAFILMSRDETERLPNVVKEAMAMRCLCIASETTGIDELILDGVTGIVVPQGEHRLAAHRLGAALRDRERTDGMREAAYRHVAEHFDARRAMRQYIQRWSALVAAKRRPPARLARHAPADPTFREHRVPATSRLP